MKFAIAAAVLALSFGTAAFAQQPPQAAAQQVVTDWSTVQGTLGHLARSIKDLMAENESLRAKLADLEKTEKKPAP